MLPNLSSLRAVTPAAAPPLPPRDTPFAFINRIGIHCQYDDDDDDDACATCKRAMQAGQPTTTTLAGTRIHASCAPLSTDCDACSENIPHGANEEEDAKTEENVKVEQGEAQANGDSANEVTDSPVAVSALPVSAIGSAVKEGELPNATTVPEPGVSKKPYETYTKSLTVEGDDDNINGSNNLTSSPLVDDTDEDLNDYKDGEKGELANATTVPEPGVSEKPYEANTKSLTAEGDDDNIDGSNNSTLPPPVDDTDEYLNDDKEGEKNEQKVLNCRDSYGEGDCPSSSSQSLPPPSSYKCLYGPDPTKISLDKLDELGQSMVWWTGGPTQRGRAVGVMKDYKKCIFYVDDIDYNERTAKIWTVSTKTTLAAEKWLIILEKGAKRVWKK